ncbi:MAG: hypothetical protein QNK63_03470 [Flavobacteriales bacterium]
MLLYPMANDEKLIIEEHRIDIGNFLLNKMKSSVAKRNQNPTIRMKTNNYGAVSALEFRLTF